jgi:hypothetical protein
MLHSAITGIGEQQTGSITAFEVEIDALIECLLEVGMIVEATT